MRWLLVAAAFLSSPAPAGATYSIAGVDTSTSEVGGAGTSCVGALSVRVIYGSVPGIGVVHAQAQLGGPGKDAAVMQVGEGTAPTDIIIAITDSQFDGNAQRRQYGIVDLQLRAAGFTGTQNGAFAGDRQGEVGTIAYTVQGNILTGMAVLDQAATAFEGSGCDLADRLMLALEAGALNGQGDSRCTPRGVPADSAFIQVDRAGQPAGTYLRIDVTDTGAEDPLAMVRVQYDAWRAINPCPVVAPDGGAGGGDGGIDPPVDNMGSGCCSGGRDHTGVWLGFAIAVAFGASRRRISSSRARSVVR